VTLLVPDPGGSDDFVDLGVIGLPTQFCDGFFAAGDEECRVAGSAGAEFYRDGVSGNAADGVDNLFYGEAGSVAEVIDEPLLGGAVGFESFEGEEMGVGQIADVDVVADAGAVVGGVVVAEDLDGGAAAEGYVEDERNEMRLGFVGFASVDDSAAGCADFGGAGYVEIPKRGGAQAVNPVKPAKHVFDEELGFAVGVGGAKGCGFGDRNGFRFAVDGGCGAENNALRAGCEDGFEQGESGSCVVAEVDFGVFHRFASFDECGEVQDAVKGSVSSSRFAKEAFDAGAICNVGLDKLNAIRNLFATGVAEVVDYHDLVSSLDKKYCDCSAYIPGAAGDHDLHKIFAFCAAVCCKFNLSHRLDRLAEGVGPCS
jgi:hypothetical protein